MSFEANILVGPKCVRLKDFAGPYGMFIFGPHIASTPKKPRDREKEFCNLPRWQAYALSIIHQIHAVNHQPRNQVCGLFVVERVTEVKPHFRWGPGSKFLGTKLELFEASWILELDPSLDPSLHLGSPNPELSFELFFWVWTDWFSSQNGGHVGLASICHFLVLDPLLKATVSIYCSQPMGLLYFNGPWILDPEHYQSTPIPKTEFICS